MSSRTPAKTHSLRSFCINRLSRTFAERRSSIHSVRSFRTVRHKINEIVLYLNCGRSINCMREAECFRFITDCLLIERVQLSSLASSRAIISLMRAVL